MHIWCFNILLCYVIPVRRLNVVEFMIESSVSLLFADPANEIVRKHCEEDVSETSHHGDIERPSMFADTVDDPSSTSRGQVNLEGRIQTDKTAYISVISQCKK